MILTCSLYQQGFITPHLPVGSSYKPTSTNQPELTISMVYSQGWEQGLLGNIWWIEVTVKFIFVGPVIWTLGTWGIHFNAQSRNTNLVKYFIFSSSFSKIMLVLWSVTSCKEHRGWTGGLALQGSWVYSFPNLNYGCYTFSFPTLPFVDISTESLTFPHIHESYWNQERPDKHFKPKIS